MKKTEDVYQNIEDDLGIYIHQINSENKRHFMGEKIAIAIISKIIIEFLNGLIKPKELGEKLRSKFEGLLSNNKEKTKDELEFKHRVQDFLSENGKILLQADNFSKSQENIANYLISELNINKNKAESMALKICNSTIQTMSHENL